MGGSEYLIKMLAKLILWLLMLCSLCSLSAGRKSKLRIKNLLLTKHTLILSTGDRRCRFHRVSCVKETDSSWI